MAIEFRCPLCGSKTTTRTSQSLTPTAATARVICRSCNTITQVDLQATTVLVPQYEKNTEVFALTNRPAQVDENQLNLISQ